MKQFFDFFELIQMHIAHLKWVITIALILLPIFLISILLSKFKKIITRNLRAEIENLKNLNLELTNELIHFRAELEATNYINKKYPGYEIRVDLSDNNPKFKEYLKIYNKQKEKIAIEMENKPIFKKLI